MSQFINIFLGQNESIGGAKSTHDRLGYEIELMLNHVRNHLDPVVGEAALSSVLNYGISSYVGKQLNDASLREIANEIKLAICRFEPRLEPSSIEVFPVESQNLSSGAQQVQIRAQLKRPPLVNSNQEAGEGDDIGLFSCQYKLDLHFGRVNACTSQIATDRNY